MKMGSCQCSHRERPIFPSENKNYEQLRFFDQGVSLSALIRLRDLVRVTNPKWTTIDVNEFLIKEWTAESKSSLTSLLYSKYRTERHPHLQMTYEEVVCGKATIYLSHAWIYNFVELVDAIEVFALQNKDASFSFWFDLLINDQWNCFNKSFDWWSNTFAGAIGDIGHTLLVVLPWQNPTSLTRAWCIWELYCSIQRDALLSVTMSPTQLRNIKAVPTENELMEKISTIFSFNPAALESFNSDFVSKIFASLKVPEVISEKGRENKSVNDFFKDKLQSRVESEYVMLWKSVQAGTEDL